MTRLGCQPASRIALGALPGMSSHEVHVLHDEPFELSGGLLLCPHLDRMSCTANYVNVWCTLTRMSDTQKLDTYLIEFTDPGRDVRTVQAAELLLPADDPEDYAIFRVRRDGKVLIAFAVPSREVASIELMDDEVSA